MTNETFKDRLLPVWHKAITVATLTAIFMLMWFVFAYFIITYVVLGPVFIILWLLTGINMPEAGLNKILNFADWIDNFTHGF